MASSIDWRIALLCASAITDAAPYSAQDAALRAVQACLVDEHANVDTKTAATILLERMGNWPAINLAVQRNLIASDAWLNAPEPMQLDVIRKRLQLTIPAAANSILRVNTFQRRFWTEASRNNWFSFTAPTSAGKSFVVKRWLLEQLNMSTAMSCIYLVPTRALIEEVSHDFRADQRFSNISIHTLPWGVRSPSEGKAIFVLTQERLHLLLQKAPDFTPSIVFVDEAQKFGDNNRGILLQRVLRDAVERKPDMQVLLASPLSTNPELLLEDAPAPVRRESLMSEVVTVNQNLLWVNQQLRNTRLWRVELMLNGEPKLIGTFELPSRPANTSLRLSLVSATLGAAGSGNVVYVNRPADAEKTARQIYETLGSDEDISRDVDIKNLQELISSTVHPQYALRTVITRGVAFHYGNMPLLLRTEVERLFRNGKIRFLVCTSTLLEGVNLPCSTLFVRGPRKGSGNYMSAQDFWNLAGRAGRWGKEFQGNIVCIDTEDKSQWPKPPTVRTPGPLQRATAEVLSDVDRLIQYISDGTPISDSASWPQGEAMYSYLASYVGNGRSLSSLPGLGLDGDDVGRLESVMNSSLSDLTVSYSIYSAHAGISPLAMQRLVDLLMTQRNFDELRLQAPESRAAWRSYYHAIRLTARYLGAGFGSHDGRHQQLAIMLVSWMRGASLAKLIEERVSYFRSADPRRSLATIIRSTMDDIEQIARFHAPKYLKCYADLLEAVPGARQSDSQQLPDLTMMLELGLSRTTDLSMMELGISRSTVIFLSEYLIPDSLTPDECRAWLLATDLSAVDIPEIARREIRNVIGIDDANIE